jgi:hypothetical protein
LDFFSVAQYYSLLLYENMLYFKTFLEYNKENNRWIFSKFNSNTSLGNKNCSQFSVL